MNFLDILELGVELFSRLIDKLELRREVSSAFLIIQPNNLQSLVLKHHVVSANIPIAEDVFVGI